MRAEAMDDDPVLLLNRGGARLKHEKEKKDLQRKLTKLEKDITKLNLDHLQSRGENFSVQGMSISDYILEQKQLADIARTDRKNLKVRKSFWVPRLAVYHDFRTYACCVGYGLTVLRRILSIHLILYFKM